MVFVLILYIFKLLNLLLGISRLNKFYQKITRMLFWNLLLTFYLEGCLEFSIVVFINILTGKSFTELESVHDYVNYVFMLIYAALVFGVPHISFYLLHKYRYRIMKEQYLTNYEKKMEITPD
jgi:heme/copper-type cytochrome/quinol oxidase subunit 2